jgi:hypothetical protein
MTGRRAGGCRQAGRGRARPSGPGTLLHSYISAEA